MTKLTYSIPEAVVASGFSRATLYREMAAGRLVARKRGSRVIFLAEDFTAWLKNLPEATITQAAA